MSEMTEFFEVRIQDIPVLQYDPVLSQLREPEVATLFQSTPADAIPLSQARQRAQELMAQRVA